MSFGPEYHKIQTVFKRTERGIIIPGEYTTDEIAYLDFEALEKNEARARQRVVETEDPLLGTPAYAARQVQG